MLIMIVDTPVQGRILEAMIFKAFPSVDILTMTTEEEALQLCQETPPDLVVFNDKLLRIGENEGLHTRIQQVCQDIPIIVVGSDLRDQLVSHIHALSEGACSFVPRPFCPRRLFEAVHACIDLAVMRRQYRAASAALSLHVSA